MATGLVCIRMCASGTTSCMHDNCAGGVSALASRPVPLLPRSAPWHAPRPRPVRVTRQRSRRARYKLCDRGP
eukprot:3789106-Prymnesium_polylepis.2